MTIHDILHYFPDAKKTSNGWMARCPAHEDDDPSLSISEGSNGRILLNCFGGCNIFDILTKVGLKQTDLFNDPPKIKKQVIKSTGCSLSDYAKAKNLLVEFLQNLGIKESDYNKNPQIEIPYYNEDGSQAATRYRRSLSGKDKFRWNTGDKASLYGLGRLNDYDNPIIFLVEGESDSQTLWFHNIQALGLPGANNWKEKRDVPKFNKFSHIFIIIESNQQGKPDPGGKTILKWLKDSDIKSKVWIFRLPTNDISELHINNPDNFKEELKDCLRDDAISFQRFENQRLEKIKLRIENGETKTKKKGSEDAIDEINKKYALTRIRERICILYETCNEHGSPELEYLSEYSFCLKFRNKRIPNPDRKNDKRQAKTIPLAKAWLESPRRREFESTMFEPGADTDDTINSKDFFNTYKGFGRKPVEGDWSLYQAHLLENICNNQHEYFLWLIAWLAKIVQFPGKERPGTFIVLKGSKGTGKDVFAKNFGEIFGHHYMEVNSADQIVGKFNNHLRNRVVVFVNEVDLRRYKAAEGRIKSLATSPTLKIEPKGFNIIEQTNHLNLIIASDNSWVIPAGEMERRFFVLDVANYHLQDYKYFAAIDNQMNNGGIEAFMYYLTHFDISGFNLRQVPRTKALDDQSILNLAPFQAFWLDLLMGSSSWEWENNKVAVEKMYNLFTDYCSYRRIKEETICKVMFGKELKNYACYSEIEKDDLRDRQTIAGERICIYNLPSKKKCRIYFIKKTNIGVNWETSKILKQKVDDIGVDGI